MSLTLAGVDRLYELVSVSTADESDEPLPVALLNDAVEVEAAAFLSSLSDLQASGKRSASLAQHAAIWTCALVSTHCGAMLRESERRKRDGKQDEMVGVAGQRARPSETRPRAVFPCLSS